VLEKAGIKVSQVSAGKIVLPQIPGKKCSFFSKRRLLLYGWADLLKTLNFKWIAKMCTCTKLVHNICCSSHNLCREAFLHYKLSPLFIGGEGSGKCTLWLSFNKNSPRNSEELIFWKMVLYYTMNRHKWISLPGTGRCPRCCCYCCCSRCALLGSSLVAMKVTINGNTFGSSKRSLVRIPPWCKVFV
jgi:hypothetical protein